MTGKRPVLVDLLWHPLQPAGTGNRRRIIELASRCADLDIRLIGPSPEPHLPDIPYTVSPPSSIRIPRMGFNPGIFRYWFPGASRRLIRTVVSTQPDIIHAEGLWIAPCACRASRALGIPWAVTVNNIESLVLKRRNRHVAAAVVLFLEKYYYSRADAVFAVSEEDRQRLATGSGMSATDIITVPNGVSRDLPATSPASIPHPNIFFMGKTDYPPNEEAIRVLTGEWMPRIYSSFPHGAVIVGGPSEPGTRRRITYTGYVEDLRPYLAAADICVAPLRAGSGTRLKILEYLAASKPVIATGIAVEGLDLRDGVHYLNAETGDDFARALGRLVSEVDLADRLGRAGREAVKRFDWSTSADIWSNSLLTLLS